MNEKQPQAESADQEQPEVISPYAQPMEQASEDTERVERRKELVEDLMSTRLAEVQIIGEGHVALRNIDELVQAKKSIFQEGADESYQEPSQDVKDLLWALRGDKDHEALTFKKIFDSVEKRKDTAEDAQRARAQVQAVQRLGARLLRQVGPRKRDEWESEAFRKQNRDVYTRLGERLVLEGKIADWQLQSDAEKEAIPENKLGRWYKQAGEYLKNSDVGEDLENKMKAWREQLRGRLQQDQVVPQLVPEEEVKGMSGEVFRQHVVGMTAKEAIAAGMSGQEIETGLSPEELQEDSQEQIADAIDELRAEDMEEAPGELSTLRMQRHVQEQFFDERKQRLREALATKEGQEGMAAMWEAHNMALNTTGGYNPEFISGLQVQIDQQEEQGLDPQQVEDMRRFVNNLEATATYSLERIQDLPQSKLEKARRFIFENKKVGDLATRWRTFGFRRMWGKQAQERLRTVREQVAQAAEGQGAKPMADVLRLHNVIEEEKKLRGLAADLREYKGQQQGNKVRQRHDQAKATFSRHWDSFKQAIAQGQFGLSFRPSRVGRMIGASVKAGIATLGMGYRSFDVVGYGVERWNAGRRRKKFEQQQPEISRGIRGEAVEEAAKAYESAVADEVEENEEEMSTGVLEIAEPTDEVEEEGVESWEQIIDSYFKTGDRFSFGDYDNLTYFGCENGYIQFVNGPVIVDFALEEVFDDNGNMRKEWRRLPKPTRKAG